MSEQSEKINIIELLMGIKEDVSSIKTDMANFKETQRTEREAIMKEISDVRTDYQRDIADLESRVMSKINGLQSVQNNLVGDVDTLQHAEEQTDAKKWRTVIAFIITAVGGMITAKIPDFITFLVQLKTLGGN